MLDTLKTKELYTKIQSQLGILIPEKWESIYLYAGINTQLKEEQTWELYFYYFPKKVLKRNPINVYEIPSNFNIEEKEYLQRVQNLCDTIKLLYKEYKNNNQKLWKNITIIMQSDKFIVHYSYKNQKNYSNNENHIIWKYKYLNVPIEQFSRKEKSIINSYLKSNIIEDIETEECEISGNYIYSEIGYNVEKTISKNRQKNKVAIQNKIKSEDEVNEIRNQMLKFY